MSMQTHGLNGWQLVWTQLWQVTLLIVAAVGFLRMVGRNRPHLAYGVWFVVALKCVTPPLWSSSGGVFCWLQPTTVSVEVHQTRDNEQTLNRLRQLAEFRTQVESTEGSEIRVSIPQAGMGESEPDSLSWVAPEFGERSEIPTRRPWSTIVGGSLAGAWILGTLGWISWTAVRLIRCRRRWRVGADREHPVVVPLVTRLCRQLGIWRPVSVLVTREAVGPAVIGLFRPTIILPRALVERKSAEELTPLLAHELVHVRRGDLWMGLLQTVAVGVWWFHPLVRLASRRLSREAERCCDEEVLAELGCEPAGYARSLLDVLELKSTLTPVPAFPGVRPVEITSQRLERIMQIGQGGHRRAPLWCRLAVVVFAGGVLPGAALAWKEPEPVVEDRLKEPQPVVTRAEPVAREESPDRQAVPVPQPVADDARKQSLEVESLRVYALSDITLKLHRQLNPKQPYRPKGAEAKANRELLFNFVNSLWTADATGDGEPKPLPPAAQPADANDARAATAHVPKAQPVTLAGEMLYVRASADRHREVAELLDSCRRFGLQQYVVEVLFISTPKGFVETLGLPGQPLPKAIPDVGANESVTIWRDGEPSTQAKEADADATVTRTERRTPSSVTILTPEHLKKLREAVQATARGNILMAPKVTTFNAQSVNVNSSAQRPFVVGATVKPDGTRKPTIRVIESGVWLRLRPLQMTDDRVRLEVMANVSEITDVTTTTLRGAEGEEPLTIQVPEVAQTRIQSTVEIKPGSTLLLEGATRIPAKGEPEDLLFLVTVKQVNPAEVDQKEAPPRPEPARGVSKSADGNSATLANPSQPGATPEVHSVSVDGWRIAFRGTGKVGSRIRMEADNNGISYVASGEVVLTLDPPGSTEDDETAYALQADNISITVPTRVKAVDQPGRKRFQIEARGSVKFLAVQKLHATCDAAQFVIADSRIQESPTAKPAPTMELLLSGGVRMVSLTPDGEDKDKFDADQVQLNLPFSELRGVVQLSGGLTSNQSHTPAEGRVKPGETIRVPIGTEQRIRVPVLNAGAKGDEMQVRTYAVADLVISPQTVVVAGDPQTNDLETQKMAPEFKESDLDSVAELISTTIAPDSWDTDAGRSIRPNVSSLSLVIRQSSGVHQQIADLLKQLRTLQDLQVAIELNRFELSTEAFATAVEQSGSPALRPLTAADAKVAVAVAAVDSRRLLASLSPKTPKSEPVKLTLQGGQAADLLASALGTQFAQDEGRLRIQPLTGGTLHKLQLQLSWRESATGAASRQFEKTLRVGESLVVDLTAFRQGRADQGEVGVPILNKLPHVDRLFKNAGPNLPAERTYLVITPRLVLAEPEEATATQR